MLTLQKYNGLATRHTCPACGRAKKFTRYIDTETGQYLADHVGRCDRESSCGYHYKPKDYFADNFGSNEPFNYPKSSPLPTKRIRSNSAYTTTQAGAGIERIEHPKKVGTSPKYGSRGDCGQIAGIETPNYMSPVSVKETVCDYDRNNFVQFLLSIFPFEADLVWNAVKAYLIGTDNNGRTVFWQVDDRQKIRTGKAFAYNANTGKRDKTRPPYFLHPKIDFKLRQCFFGEHILPKFPGLPVAIVESEKSAVVASIWKADMVWLACGGKSHLNAERMAKLGRERKIILYPDADSYEKWHQIALDARRLGLKVRVSDLIEKRATEAEKATGADLADYLIRDQQKRCDLLIQQAFWDLIEERLAIMTIDGGLTEERAEAEINASEYYAEATRGALYV